MGSRILLADDSITIQKVVNLTFADEGIEVVAVSNGEMAERRLAEVGPDLVLADIFMPGKNGYELCEAIKQNPQFHNVPVVLLVGAFEPFDQAEARRVRADAHLTKPFESRTLVETVRRLISASWRGTTGPIAPTPINEERQAARDHESVETAPAPPAASLDTNPDLSAPMTDSSVAPSTPFVRNTGELASPALSAQPEGFQLGIVDAPVHEMAAATLPSSGEHTDDTGFSSSSNFVPGETASEFPLDSQEMIMDFDKSEPFEAAASSDKHSFEAEADALLDVDVSGAGEGGDWFSRESLGTTGLDTSAGGGWPPSTGSSPLGQQTAGFRMYNETGFDASETSTETACATLLAVDEPLGDVLLGEALSINASPQSEVLSSDLPGLDFNEPDITEPEPMTSTQFDLVHISEASSTLESGEVLETSSVEETQTVNDSPEIVAAGPTVESRPAVSDANVNHDWTSPHAGVYSTAQLDPIMMPIAAAEHTSDNSNGSDALKAESTPEASFTTTGTWAEEEARFTAIDIDAVSVEQPEPQPDSADTGFSFLSPAAEEPASDVEDRAAGSESAKETAAPTDLSSAAIEEIVRRVVAEMSESVVREVAWEVVPDCVERVIEQLTRESLSKRA